MIAINAIAVNANVIAKPMDKCLVVNLFGAPGAGKSTAAAYIFSMLKFANINAELVTEFAKDMVWEENKGVFKPDNQCYLFGEQYNRLSRCKDKVDVIVTDSPLPLSILYKTGNILGESFDEVVMSCFDSFENMNFLLVRNKPYNPIGRFQTEEESDSLLEELRKLLADKNINHSVFYSNRGNLDSIVNKVLEKLNNLKDIGRIN